MGKGAKSVLGMLCVAALISLPTLQAGNSTSQSNLVAIAEPNSAQQNPEVLAPEVDAEDGLGGPVGSRDHQSDATHTARIPAPASSPVATSTLAPDNGKWVWPTPSKLITSPFGYRSDPFTGGSAFHSGLDLGDGCGTMVGATRPGIVTFAGPAGGYGNRVVVDHGQGIWSAYSHLQQVDVRVGQTVQQSELVGLVGTTGRSTGCHLHFEIIVNGGFADPLPYLQGQPVADPFTYGNGNIPAAPISEPDETSSSPTPSPTQDPCEVSEDPKDALDSGGLIPVDEPRTADGKPCPTPTKSPTSTSKSPSTPGSPSTGTTTPGSPSSPGSNSSTPNPSSPT